MPLEPGDFDTLGRLLDEKLNVSSNGLDERDQRILQEVELKIQARFQAELQQARLALSAHAGQVNGQRPQSAAADDGGLGQQPPAPPSNPPARQPPEMRRPQGGPGLVLANSLLTAIETDPVGAIGALLDKSLEAFIKFRQAVAPHPYDQALQLMQNYPQVTALWAPNPLGPWQQQAIYQSMMLGAQAARGMKGTLLFPNWQPEAQPGAQPGGNQLWPAIPSSGPSAVPQGPSGTPSPTSIVPSPGPNAVPPGLPAGPPALMHRDLSAFSWSFE